MDLYVTKEQIVQHHMREYVLLDRIVMVAQARIVPLEQLVQHCTVQLKTDHHNVHNVQVVFFVTVTISDGKILSIMVTVTNVTRDTSVKKVARYQTQPEVRAQKTFCRFFKIFRIFIF